MACRAWKGKKGTTPPLPRNCKRDPGETVKERSQGLMMRNTTHKEFNIDRWW